MLTPFELVGGETQWYIKKQILLFSKNFSSSLAMTDDVMLYCRLNKWPIFRDLSFYLLSVILLFIFFIDNSIAWYEAGVLISLYTMYLIVLAFNNKIEQKLNVCLKISQEV